LCLLVMLPRPPLPPLFPYTRSSDLEPRMLVVVLQEGALVKHAQFVYAGGDHIRVFLPTTAPLDSSREPLECPYVYPTDACVNGQDRKSTRLNSSHVKISYAVFCLKK